MGWGQQHTAGTGNTRQIEDAHKAFDALGVPEGPLAVRAITAAGVIDRLRTPTEDPTSPDEGEYLSARTRELLALVHHHRARALAGRRFVLQRHEDVTGVSGTGTVAEGVEFSNGVVALQWMSTFPTSVVFHQRGMESVRAVHGHGGATEVRWLDTEGGTNGE